MHCDCCGQGLLEIKCPLSAANKEASPQNVKCLEHVEGQVRLKRHHEYYSQVQFQMGVTGRQWCHFILFTKCDSFVEGICFDALLWEKLLLASRLFFRNHICPKLFS